MGPLKGYYAQNPSAEYQILTTTLRFLKKNTSALKSLNFCVLKRTDWTPTYLLFIFMLSLQTFFMTKYLLQPFSQSSSTNLVEVLSTHVSPVSLLLLFIRRAVYLNLVFYCLKGTYHAFCNYQISLYCYNIVCLC